MLDIQPERSTIEELNLMYDDDPQSTRRGTKLILAILAFIAAGAAATQCEGAPRVANQEQCALVGDMVLVAAALNKHDVPPEKRAGVMEDTYRDALGGGEAKKWREIMEIAMRFVRRGALRELEPQDLADGVAQACHASRGNLDQIFGAES